MPQSWLEEGGTNLFQLIKGWCVEAEAKGIDLLRLSIGQPTGPALLSARKAAAEAVMSDAESMHEYQDNGSPGVPDFASRFVQALVRRDLRNTEVVCLPTPGTKSMLGLAQLACYGGDGATLSVATMTDPGYPTPWDWAAYLNLHVRKLPLDPVNRFRFSVSNISTETQLIMINYPHNPSGQTASQGWLKELCAYCEQWDTRLINDAAYAPLAHRRTSCTLTEVAVDFPKLSWAEAFSASKVIGNGTGWRVGAIVGSPDFIGDIAKIKGNTDSGFVAFSAAGVIHAVENDKEGIKQCRKTYEERIRLLIASLTHYGMRLAVEPGAGFFTLWKVPKKAFGQEVKDAEHFNRMMIERTGLVGVHFNPDYIRYAVTGDIKAMLPDIEAAIIKAAVSYS